MEDVEYIYRKSRKQRREAEVSILIIVILTIRGRSDSQAYSPISFLFDVSDFGVTGYVPPWWDDNVSSDVVLHERR